MVMVWYNVCILGRPLGLLGKLQKVLDREQTGEAAGVLEKPLQEPLGGHWGSHGRRHWGYWTEGHRTRGSCASITLEACKGHEVPKHKESKHSDKEKSIKRFFEGKKSRRRRNEGTLMEV